MENRIASPWRRFLASFIDGLLMGLFSGVHWTGALIALAYCFTKDALPFLKGQSLGKKALGIRVVKDGTGGDITGDYAASAVRQVPLMIPVLNLVDSLMVFSARGRRFGDRWAKTVVVLERP